MDAVALTCTSVCRVEGLRIKKRFYLAARSDEDDAVTMSRALKRAREILCHENGVTAESVEVESLTYS